MSSHHIVRDNQEPAVIFHDMKGCNVNVLNDVLEWSPFIVAYIDTLSFLLSKNTKLDVVFAETGDEVKLDIEQSHIEYISIEGDKDEGVVAMIGELERKGHQAVYLFSTLNKTLQKQLLKTNLIISLFDGNKKWSLVKKEKLRKWFPEKVKINIKSDYSVSVYNERGENIIIEEPLTESGIITIESNDPYWLGEYVFG